MSRLEAHAGFFRLLMKGIFDPYLCTVTFRQKVDFQVSSIFSTRHSKVLQILCLQRSV